MILRAVITQFLGLCQEHVDLLGGDAARVFLDQLLLQDVCEVFAIHLGILERA